MTQPIGTIEGLIAAWRDDPVLFVRSVFGAEPQAWQERVLRGLNEHSLVSIRSGKGVGKSSLLAWIILWFLATRTDVKVPCTANSQSQLYDVLWAECRKWVEKMSPEMRVILPYEVKSDRIEIAGNFAVARTARRENPEALQGFHAKNVLMVVDEASGVDDAVFQAAEGALTTEGARMILTSNPTRPSGYFYDTHHRDRGRWWSLKVSCTDSPYVSNEYVEGLKAKWGEDSNEYRVGVLGEFPLMGAHTIIPLNWVEAAVGRDMVDNAPVVWGLDVARFGTDRTALAKRQGRILMEKVQAWQGRDLMETTGIIVDQYYSLPIDLRPVEIMVDVIGYGAGVVDRMKEMKLPVRGVNVAERKSVRPDCLCLRDELWFRAREWFQGYDCRIPEDNDLIAELSGIEYKYSSTGKKFVEDKHQLGWSPDLADAFTLTFASSLGRRQLVDKLGRGKSRQTVAITDASYVEALNV